MYNEPGLPPGPDREPALLAAILVKSLTIRGLIQTEFAADLMGELLERRRDRRRPGPGKMHPRVSADVPRNCVQALRHKAGRA